MTSPTITSPFGPRAGEFLLLYDGDCGLCQRSVRFVLDRDPRKRFRFAALQSPIAQELLRGFGQDPAELASVCLIRRGRDGGLRLHRKGRAVRSIAWNLSIPWRLLSLPLWLVPPPWLDAGYDFIARRRMRFFGPADACRLPRPGERERFLD